jgi:PAS domain S-box-containing protein
MKQNWVLIVLTALLLSVASLLILYLHYQGIQEVLSQFQGQQLSQAKNLSNQIRFFLQARSRGLRALSSFASFQYGDLQQQRTDIESYTKQITQVYVMKAFLCGPEGIISYSTDPKEIGMKRQDHHVLAWARQEEHRDRILLSPVFSGPHSLRFDLAIPLYQQTARSKGAKPGVKFAGVLAITLDMREFLLNQVRDENPQMNLDQVWIISRDGTLLFQPDHPEMVLRNIYKGEGNCSACHLSFKYIEDILVKGQGTVDYEIRKHPKKIAAFTTMDIENVSWVVVVNAPYDRVTGFIRKSLREHLILIGIVVFAFGISSTLLLRKERMKIRAEEEVVRWQEKMDERKKAEESLESERDKLKRILDSTNDGVYIVNQRHEILYTNPVVANQFGPVQGRKCHEYFYDLPEICPWCKSNEVFTGKSVRWEWYSVRTGRTYDLFDTPFMGPDGTLCKLQFIRDISDRKRAERALRQSEKRYRMLVETMNEGLGLQDENGVWVYVNDRFSEMLGYTRDEMIGNRVTDFLSETDQAIYQEQVDRRRRGEVESYGLSWMTKDGQRVFTRVSPKAIFNERGQFKGSFAIVTDMTERKRAEEALKESEKQLRALSSQLLTAQETERKRISRELHDELGQSLTVMKLRLNFIEKSLLKDQAEIKRECEYGVGYIDQVIENVRRLSRDLSPTILEDFGLSAAIRWLVNNFAKSYNIKVVLNMMDVDALLPQDSYVVVYRTVQEALTNIGKHSQAKNGSVTISLAEGSVRFSIEDDGIGFDERLAVPGSPREKGLGLTTMKGRAQMVGGVLFIWSQKGKGTRITLSIPMKPGVTS